MKALQTVANKIVFLWQKITEKTSVVIQNFRFSEISLIRKIIITIGLVFLLIFPVSAIMTHTISDDLSFRNTFMADTESSLVVSDVISIINQEVVENGWIANKPFFFPQAMLLDNMPSYQMGMFYGLSAIVNGIAISTDNNELQVAAKALQTPGTQWGFGENNAVNQYMKAKNILQKESASIEMNKDIFISLIEQSKIVILNRFRENIEFLEKTSLFLTDNEFYYNRGMLYALFITLRDASFEMQEKEDDNYLSVQADKLLSTLKKAINYEPEVIVSLSETPSVITNHILVQNYYMAETLLIINDILNRR